MLGNRKTLANLGSLNSVTPLEAEPEGLSALAVMILFSSPAVAFSLKNEVTGGACTADRQPCDVWCDNGAIAGEMYWDGSERTGGTRFNADQNVEAKAISISNPAKAFGCA